MGIVNLTGEVHSNADFAAWLARTDLSAVTELILWSAHLDDNATRALAARTDTHALRYLDLSHNHVGAGGAQALAGALPQLDRLRLYHNALGPQGCRAIASGAWRLQSLNVCGNAIGAAGIAALRGPAVEGLQSLHLGWDELGDDGALALAHGQWPALAELNVRSNAITHVGAAALLRGGLPALAKLGVDDNPLGDPGLETILASPGFRRLTWLNLTATELTERAVAMLAAADTSTLRELRIGANELPEEVVDELPGFERCKVAERVWSTTLSIQERGGEVRTETFLDHEITIGRVKGNTIVLPRGNVSKRHCRLVISKQGKAIIVDLKSTNGMWVNGRRLTAPLVVGTADMIYVGDFIIRVVELPTRVE